VYTTQDYNTGYESHGKASIILVKKNMLCTNSIMQCHKKMHQLNRLLAYLRQKVIKSHEKVYHHIANYVIVVLLISHKVPYFL
jgi:hypothetical protein